MFSKLPKKTEEKDGFFQFLFWISEISLSVKAYAELNAVSLKLEYLEKTQLDKKIHKTSISK